MALELEDDDLNLSNAVEYFTGGGEISQFRTKMALASLEKHAKETGLEAGQITSLVDMAGSCRLGTQLLQKLIRCLIPQEHVEQEAALKVVSFLGIPETPTSVKTMLLKWTILVFDLLDGEDLLSSLYDVLFYFIDFDTLRPFVCQLLCFMTRREHVMEFRVHKLLDLLKRVDVNNQPIVSLLWAYKVYRPDLLSVSVKSRKAALFKSPERVLAADILRVQAKRKTARPQSLLAKSIQVTPPSKRRKFCGALPRPTALEINRRDSHTALVSQLSSVEDLVDNLEHVELPSQMASSLESLIVRHLLTVAPGRDAAVRLTFWLEHCISEVFFAHSPDENPQAERILDSFVSLTGFLQDPMTAVQYFFLSGYLPLWNGVKYRYQILQLMTYLQPEPFEEFRRTYLMPIDRLFFALDVFFKADVLCCWQRLLYNLLTPDWRRREGVFGSLLVEDQDVDQVDFIEQFVEYVGGLCTAALQTERNHPLVQSAVLSFFDAVCEIYQTYGIRLMILPLPCIVYRLMFSLSLSGTAGMCRLLVKYKPAFEKVAAARMGSLPPFANYLAVTKQLNCYIMDVCNGLWRSSAFRVKQKEGPGTLLFEIRKETLSALCLPKVHDTLLVYTNVTFLGLTWKYLQAQQQESQKALHPRNISKPQRIAFLDFLRQHHVESVDDFISTFTTIRN